MLKSEPSVLISSFMLSSSVQGVKIRQKAQPRRRSHGEGPRHCQPHQLSGRRGHGCTWWKQHIAKRRGDGKDRRHRVMLWPLCVWDVASWHRVRRHLHTTGRLFISTAVLLWSREPERAAAKDSGWWSDPRKCLSVRIYQPFHQICADRPSWCKTNVTVTTLLRSDLYAHLLDCPEVFPHLWSDWFIVHQVSAVRSQNSKESIQCSSSCIWQMKMLFLFILEVREKNKFFNNCCKKDLQLKRLIVGNVRLWLQFSRFCIFYQIKTENEPRVLFFAECCRLSC